MPHGTENAESPDADVWSKFDLDDFVLQEVVPEDAVGEVDDEELKELKILNYLMGKPLSADEESEVLRSLQNTNAACIEDLLQIVSEDSAAGSRASQASPEAPPDNSEQQVEEPSREAPQLTLDVASCMRLRVGTLELSSDGLAQVRGQKQQASATGLLFIINYLPPRSTVNNAPIRLCSKRVCKNIVTFEQEKFHSCESNQPLRFSILVKKPGCQETLFGEAFFDWTKLLLTETTKSDLCLIVNQRNTAVGKLKIKVQIGDEGDVSPRGLREALPNPTTREQSPEVVEESAEPEVQIVKETKRKSPPAKSPEKSILLRNLFLATSMRNCKDLKNPSLFLVLKAFWLDEDVKSSLASCTKGAATFDFNLIAPVLLSPYFLTRCKGNNAILEVWSATSRGNELVGFSLLPLHTFYLAYHDNLVTKALLDCKLPVISVDHWLPIVSTRNGEQVGEINCLLAFGSDEQVTHLEQQRGLRNSEIVSPVHAKLQSQEPKEMCIHSLKINILKVSDLFGAKVEAEFFVDCCIPSLDQNGLTLSKLSTSTSACAIESKLACQLTHQIDLPVGITFSNFISKQAKASITFSVFCNFKQPKNKSIKVAETTLPLDEICFLEKQYLISEQPAFLSLALPLKKEDSDVSRLVATSKGSLVVRLEYSHRKPNDQVVEGAGDAPVATRGTQTEVQLSDFTEGPEEASGTAQAEAAGTDPDQLWSTTLLSQLQRLRISRTASAAPAAKEEAPRKTFRCLVQVEKAVQLPYLKSATHTAVTHSEPCTYVSISNIGDANVSPVVLYSVDPVWNWSSAVDLPTHLLLEGGENLVLKVWQLPKCGDMPSTKTDPILCFAAVQIGDLKYGLPKISGWFNLVNYSGKYCGKIYLSISPMEDLAQLMFANRTAPKHTTASPPSYVPAEPIETKPNPFIDLSTSVMESTLRQQLTDLDELSSMLKGSVSVSLNPEEPSSTAVARLSPSQGDESEKKESGSESSEDESSSSGSVDSDVARLLAKFDLETLHKIVEQLDDEVMKMNRCSKPDYVCAKAAGEAERPARDELPAIELDQASCSDSGIATSARKRHLPE